PRELFPMEAEAGDDVLRRRPQQIASPFLVGVQFGERIVDVPRGTPVVPRIQPTGPVRREQDVFEIEQELELQGTASSASGDAEAILVVVEEVDGNDLPEFFQATRRV